MGRSAAHIDVPTVNLTDFSKPGAIVLPGQRVEDPPGRHSLSWEINIREDLIARLEFNIRFRNYDAITLFWETTALEAVLPGTVTLMVARPTRRGFRSDCCECFNG
jgi:hypothetical protein